MEVKRKHSKQREAILNALAATNEHPTAEMLYNTLKPDYPELSLGTVYRNLAVLMEDGLVVKVAHVAGQERYDARIEPHPHFVCRDCHSVIDLELPDVISPLCSGADRMNGCSVEGYVLTVSGLCADCAAGA